MKEWSVLMILICIEDKRSSADTKRQVLAVDEARTASLIAYFCFDCHVGIEVDSLFVCHCISKYRRFI